MNVSSLQARVLSLRRKLALPYAQLMVQRMADNLCSEWSRAQAENRPTPSPQAFVCQVAKTGFRLPTFTGAVHYLERCALLQQEPSPPLLLCVLLPWASTPRAPPEQLACPSKPGSGVN